MVAFSLRSLNFQDTWSRTVSYSKESVWNFLFPSPDPKPKFAEPRNDGLDSVPNPSRQLWFNHAGSMLIDMMQLAGYHEEFKHSQAGFFNDIVASSLGVHPAAHTELENSHWKSFMNDDCTPIEFSWSWNSSKALPILRYGIEPIGAFTGSSFDPLNIRESERIVELLAAQIPTIDLVWHNHFFKLLVDMGDFSTISLENSDYCSTIFLAFEMKQEALSLKTYFIPTHVAASLGESNHSVIERAIRRLPCTDDPILQSFDHLSQYLKSFPLDKRPVTEMVGIDCIDPRKARIKIYVRSRETSFDSVLEMISLRGRAPQGSDVCISSLESLWRSVLSLDHTYKTCDPLPVRSHRTAGIIYHFDLRIGKTMPTVKVYIPVKHYGENDQRIAEGLSTFLHSQGMELNGSSYVDAVASACKHRPLESGLGFQTYVSCAFDGDGLAITSYLQPEIYHALQPKIFNLFATR